MFSELLKPDAETEGAYREFKEVIAETKAMGGKLIETFDRIDAQQQEMHQDLVEIHQDLVGIHQDLVGMTSTIHDYNDIYRHKNDVIEGTMRSLPWFFGGGAVQDRQDSSSKQGTNASRRDPRDGDEIHITYLREGDPRRRSSAASDAGNPQSPNARASRRAAGYATGRSSADAAGLPRQETGR